MHHLARITCHSPLGFMPHDYDYDYDSGHDYDHDYDYDYDYVSLISSDFPCLRSLYVQITCSLVWFSVSSVENISPGLVLSI